MGGVSYEVSQRHEASLTSFMVKATRDQSSDAPNRVNWLVIFSWYLRGVSDRHST